MPVDFGCSVGPSAAPKRMPPSIGYYIAVAESTATPTDVTN